MIPIQLSQASGVPYYRQVVEQIAALIQSGSLSAGSQLPSVRQLAADLLVSLITVRRAYAELESAGLIERRQGQGTFVTPRLDDGARARGRDEARALLADATHRARQLGLDDSEILELVEELTTQGART